MVSAKNPESEYILFRILFTELAWSDALCLKNRLVCPFDLKIRRVCRSIFFFFFFLNLDTEKMQYDSCVCIFGQAEPSELVLFYNVGGGYILSYLIEVSFWDSFYIFWQFILTFFLKIQNKNQKKTNKKPDPYFPISWVGQKRANKHLFSFRPYDFFFFVFCQNSTSWPFYSHKLNKKQYRNKVPKYHHIHVNKRHTKAEVIFQAISDYQVHNVSKTGR